MSLLPGARRLLLVVLLIPSVAPPAYSRSIDHAIEQVLAAHPSVKALESALQAAEAAVHTAGAWPDPQISWATAVKTYDSDRLSPRQIYAFSQRLPWQSKRELERRAQKSEADARQDELTDLRLILAGRVRQLHAQWVYLEAALRINRDNQQLVSDLSRVALQAYAAGHSSQPAVTEAQLRLSVLQQEELQLNGQIASLQAEWQALQATASNAMAGPAPATPLPALPSEDKLLQAVGHANAELAALSDRMVASAQREARARQDYWPDLTLKFSHVGTLDPEEKRSQIGLSLELPLDLARRRGAVAMAAAQQLQLKWRRQDRLASIEAEVRSRLAKARTSDDTRTLFRDALLPQAQSHLEAARAAWRAGHGEFSAVIASEEQLLRLRMGLEAAVRDAHIHRSELDRLTGGQLTNSLFGEPKP